MIKLDIQIRKKIYPTDTQCILNDLSFSVSAGEFVSLIGPSGTGKTTLLNIIAGLDADYDGELHFNDQEISTTDTSIKRGFMFQEPRLMPWLTVSENIHLVMNKPNENEDVDVDVDVVKTLLNDVELGGYHSQYPLRLSGGMQRRVALARAFSINPHLLLMDEPFVSLDLPTANRLRDYLISIWQKNQPTVVFVTHDLREAILLSDRIIFLSKKPATVIKEYEVKIKRPRQYGQIEIETIYDELLAKYPELLSGDVTESMNGLEKQRQKIA